MSRILLARIGWMKFYTGPQIDDSKPIGGGSYNIEHVGAEARNFKEYHKKIFGAFGYKPNLQRLDPNIDSDPIQDVLLIFFARDPRPQSKGQVLVGWHKNAAIFSDWQQHPWPHFSVTSSKSAVLLPTYRRTCPIPQGKNAPGQANLFYPINLNGKDPKRQWLDHVLKFINSYSGPNLVTHPEAEAQQEVKDIIEEVLNTSFAQGIQSDPAARRAIENAAMNAAIEHFKSKGFKTENVSSSQSYDLHCTKNGREYFVEVKGAQVPISKILLTPNEVSFAKNNSKKMSLFILHSIKLSRWRNVFQASGGVSHIISPWRIRLNQLAPVQYFYSLSR